MIDYLNRARVLFLQPPSAALMTVEDCADGLMIRENDNTTCNSMSRRPLAWSRLKLCGSLFRSRVDVAVAACVTSAAPAVSTILRADSA